MEYTIGVLFLFKIYFYHSTDIQIDQPDGVPDYNVLLNKEFHMHNECNSIQGENDQNSARDFHTENQEHHETSDETDSDVDTVKCGYCSQSHSNFGAHTCHVTCTIEHNELQHSSSSETLIAAEVSQFDPGSPTKPTTPLSDVPFNVSCVLCDEKYDQYDDYVTHLNNCTTNVKLHHYVCPVCHEIYTDKLTYLEHLKIIHFKSTTESDHFTDPGEDCVDFAPIMEKTRRPKAVRRQIGWSVEDIYQEIDCKKIEEKQTPTSSPIKNFFSKLGNE